MSEHGARANEHQHDDSGEEHSPATPYLRFAAMIATGMVVMYGLMFLASWEWSHVRFSQSRVYMTLTMGGAMGLVMFAWMRHMYKNTTANIAVIAVSALLLVGGTALDRGQVMVDDTAYMRGMIPHHSLARQPRGRSPSTPSPLT